jgi:hypothetical protein
VVGCATPKAQPTTIPPTDAPKSTPTAEIPHLELTFDGESCIYEGPTEINPGVATFSFINNSEGVAAANMIILDEGKTIQDVIDHNGPEPSQKHAPVWSSDVPYIWEEINPGEIHTWEGRLWPGLHALVCARIEPLGVWFGTGITVES